VSLVVKVKIGLSVAGGTTIVRTENRITVVYQVLHHCPIARTCLPTRSTVYQYQRRNLIVCTRAVWLVQDRWNLQAVKTLVANDLTPDEVALIDHRIQGAGQFDGESSALTINAI
jgi:hypothetical protein